MSANSSFFRKILTKQKDAHCFVYIRGLVFEDLKNIINFMYNGEIKVPGESLERFIQAAQDLDIRGLGPDQIKGSFPQQQQMMKRPEKSDNKRNKNLRSFNSAVALKISSNSTIMSPMKRSASSTPKLAAVQEEYKENDDCKREDEIGENQFVIPQPVDLYEEIGVNVDEHAVNYSFGSEVSSINEKINKMKQIKIDNIKRIKNSLNDNYNPNDTLDSVLPNGEESAGDTFDEEMGEPVETSQVSADSAMVIDASSASDQNAQLELEISMRLAKVR